MKLCVYCGSGFGKKSEYAEIAIQISKLLLEYNIDLIFGGSKAGLMGLVAEELLNNNRKVVGVITQDLIDRGAVHPDLKNIICVDTMYERKKVMMELSDGFLALPGGYGTLDELFEAITLAQLGLHKKPCAILNVCGYYDNLISFLDNCVSEKFIKQGHREMLIVEDNPEKIIKKIKLYKPTEVVKWINGKSD